jgi:hypothetical protein
LLFKSIARETNEKRGGFVPVPAGLNLAQGMALLDQPQALGTMVTPASFRKIR